MTTYIRIYKKGDIVDIKGMGTVYKGMPQRCYHVKLKSLQCHQHAAGVVVNKLRVRFLSMGIWSILSEELR